MSLEPGLKVAPNQDMPPASGFRYTRFRRNIPKGFHGFTIWAC